MTRGLRVLALALAAGSLAFIATRLCRCGTSPAPARVMLDALPELEWLRTELNLTDAQFASVRELHLAYRPRCAEMCHRIGEAHQKNEREARANRGVTPELSAALAAHAQVHLECQEAMLRHLYQTAALLNEHQARHYLDTLLPFTLDFSHSETGSLHGR